MWKKKNKRSPSTGKDTNSGTALPMSPLNKDTLLPKYYLSINQLPLSRFIDIVVDNNFYALVISGKPTDEQLFQAWDIIRMEYADAIKDHETRLLVSMEKELNRLKITHQQILQAIQVLRDYYTPEFKDILNDLLKTSFKLDVRFKEDYDKDLKRAYNRSKGLLIEINLKQLAYDGMLTKYQGENKKPTREYFQGILITLSDFVQYQLQDSITVFEFCDRIRRLNQFNEQQKLKNHGKRK